MEDYDYYPNAKIDTESPSFDLPFYDPKEDCDGQMCSAELDWKWYVLFYYPADFTYVCPTELKDMAEQKNKFDEMWVEILAISTDTVFSHRAWVKHEKLMHDFPYKMLADHSTDLAYILNILDWESGIAWRWTFIVDPDGILRWIEVTSWALWRHSDELIRKIEALQHMKEFPNQACPARWKTWDKTLTPDIKISGKIYEALNS